MYEFEDYSEELLRKESNLKDGILSKCVNVDTLVDDRWRKVFTELNIESCFDRNWTGLSAELLKPSPTTATIESFSNSTNPAREMLKTWVAQSEGPNASFKMLIVAMIKCEVYSACDELLDFLENFERDSNSELEQREDLDAIVSCEVTSSTIEEHLQISERQQTPSHINEIQEMATGQREQPRTQNESYRRSRSWQEGPIRRFCRKVLKRFLSAPAGGNVTPHDEPPISPQPSITPPLQEDEIFVVSSNPDNETQGMKDLMSFVHKLKPVAKRELTVKTIHDAEQRDTMSTTWLQERVDRARYVILCFSSKVKAIADNPNDMQQFIHQADYNLKFTLDFLVTGVLYFNGCRNPKGKFIPVLLPGNDLSTLIVPLRYFLHFSWPNEEKKLSNYIMNLPEYPVPHQGTAKRLVQRELPSC